MVGTTHVPLHGREIAVAATTHAQEKRTVAFPSGRMEMRSGFADGCKDTQLLPRAATANSKGEQLGWQQWWPVIFVQVDATRVAAFCQDQALALSRPWLTHVDRVVCCRGATQQLLDARGRAHAVSAQPSAPPANHPADRPAESTAYDPVHSTTVVIEELRRLPELQRWW